MSWNKRMRFPSPANCSSEKHKNLGPLHDPCTRFLADWGVTTEILHLPV